MPGSDVFILLLCVLGSHCGLVLSECVMYGFCNIDSNGLKQSCAHTGKAQLLDNGTALEILEKLCPSLYNQQGETYTCCDAEQLLTMEAQVHKSAAVFGRCPSCLQNLVRMICHSTCSPNMSDFLQITEVSSDGNIKGKNEPYVISATFYGTSHFLDESYKACSHVALPSMGKLVTDITCGIYSSSQCNTERWFHFLGDPVDNVEAPIKINYKRLDTQLLDYVPYNTTIYRCNDIPKEGSAPCSCIDCIESCSAAKNYSEEFSFLILGLDGVVFIIACIYIVFMTAFLVVKWILNRRNRQKANISHNKKLADLDQTHFNKLHYINSRVEYKLGRMFFSLGKGVAEHPTFVLAICSWIIGVCSFGCQYLIITSDPVQIWASPSSQSRMEKDYFEEKFQPFYRTEQVFLKAVNLEKFQHNTATGVIEFGPAFHKEFLLTVFALQEKIENITGFADFCFAPLSLNGVKAESKSQCVVESIYGYFGNDMSKFNKTSTDDKNFTVNYLDQIHKCLQSSVNTDCLGPYGGNIEPALAVGGFLQYGDDMYEKANAIVLTFLLNNNLTEEYLKPVIEWENQFISLLHDWIENEKPDFMDVSFRAEISIEQELAKESNAEVITIVISYICMFIYISISLGSCDSWRTMFINSKISLGLGGIFVVIASVTSSIGIFGYISTPTTLLTMEVIPFLILAVGVDNMFLIVNTCNRLTEKNKEVAQCIGEALVDIGPSIFLTSLSEAACFIIGAISDMPAVRTFALYAMVAIVINFFLQLTVFVAFLSLDLKRLKARRFDIFCCFSGRESSGQREPWIGKFLKKYVVPVIFMKFLNVIIFLSFITFFFICLATIRYIEPGLDQRLSMPEDSYLNKYFLAMDEILSMGPNVYFVLKPGLNFSQEEDQNLICGSLRCDSDSLSTQIYSASKQNKTTYIRTAASSWLDDFFDWATVEGCCKIYPNGTFCSHSSTDENCVMCNIEKNSDGMRPKSGPFRKLLPNFLLDIPDATCAKAGHAAYGQAVKYDLDLAGNVDVLDTYFMAYHTTLKTSKDYYTALKMARKIAADITKTLNSKRKGKDEIEVFAYSLFYVFYEQYLTIWETMISSLCYSFAAIFLVTFILTSFEFISALIVLINVVMIVVDLAALMYMWDINLNAITLVNLVVAAGISVEFCSHILHAFTMSDKETRKLRAEEALVKTGSSVFAGITLTKILGIIVLAFSKTQIFRVFYFRMYLGMVLFGAAHGLIFLPILLSYIGPNNKKKLFLRKRWNSNASL